MAKLTNCLEEFQIYVSTFQNYNNGSLFGKWLNLSDYSCFDELLDAMKDLHKDEEDPEFMFQDFECSNFFESQNFIGESFISSKIYEIAEQINNSDVNQEMLEAYFDCFGSSEIDEMIEKAQDSFYGNYDSDEDFAQCLLEDCGDIPQNLPSYIYIDWSRSAKDLMFDYSSSNGYYFRN
jgi:antirestriction protein